MGFFSWVMKGFGVEKKKEDNRRPISHVPSAIVTPEVPTTNAEANQVFDLRNFSAPTLFSDGFNQPNQAQYGKNLRITNPHSYQDIQMLIDSLQRGEPCIINLEGLDATDAQRKLDFLAGAIYALGGSIKTLQPNIYVLTPNGMNINGTQTAQQQPQPQVQQVPMTQPQFVSQYGPQTAQDNFGSTNSGGNSFGGGRRGY